MHKVEMLVNNYEGNFRNCENPDVQNSNDENPGRQNPYFWSIEIFFLHRNSKCLVS